MARRLTANLRSFDMVVRLGGEEFFVAMPEVGYEAALSVSDRLRRSVSISISLGVTLVSIDAPTEAGLKRTDRTVQVPTRTALVSLLRAA